MRHFPENTLSWSPGENASKVTLYGNRHQTQRISPETNPSKSSLTSQFLLHALLIHAVWAGLHASSSRFISNVHTLTLKLWLQSKFHWHHWEVKSNSNVFFLFLTLISNSLHLLISMAENLKYLYICLTLVIWQEQLKSSPFSHFTFSLFSHPA